MTVPKKEISKRLALIFVLAFSCVVAAGYFFFHPNGHWYRSQFFDGVPRSALRSYHREQTDYFKENGRFREALHLKEWHTNRKEIILGFASENAEIQKYCPDCIFEEKHYKIGAFGKFDGEDVFWTIDDQGNLIGVKTSK